MGIETSTVVASELVGTASYSIQSEFLNGTQSFEFVGTSQIYEFVPTQSFVSKEEEGDQYISGSLTVAQNLYVLGEISASKLTIEYITSSQVLVTGSTVWGDELTDTHQFTGSVMITGSLSVNGVTLPQEIPVTTLQAVLDAGNTASNNILLQSGSSLIVGNGQP